MCEMTEKAGDVMSLFFSCCLIISIKLWTKTQLQFKKKKLKLVARPKAFLTGFFIYIDSNSNLG